MVKKFLIISFALIIFLAGFGLVNRASAQIYSTSPSNEGGVNLGAPISSGETTPSSFADYTNKIYQFAVVIGISLAVLMIIFAGYKYMTTAGDPQSLAEAKEVLLGAIVGLVLILLTRLILATIDPRLLSFPQHAPVFSYSATPVPGSGTGSDLQNAAQKLCQDEKKNKKSTDWNNGPCLTPNINKSGYAVDIVHTPRQSIDDNAANTCGVTAKFYEFDLNCGFVKKAD